MFNRVLPIATIPKKKLTLYLNQYKEFVSGRNVDGIPRFGAFSFLAASTPMFIYESKGLTKLCKTAFTDGTHVFFNADFFEKLLRQQKENSSNDVEFVIMHELAHILYQHHRRLKEFPHKVANIAADISINSRLERDFPALKISQTFRDSFWGLENGNIRYTDMFEEDIAREVMKNVNWVESDEDHIIDPRALRDALEQDGLKDFADTMGLPRNKVDSDRFSQRQERKVSDVIQKSKLFNVARHSLEYAAGIVDDLAKPKTKWKGAIGDVVYGSGMSYKYTDDVPGSMYYYDHGMMGFSQPIFVGETIPAKNEQVTLVLVDTSISVSQGELKSFYSEVVGAFEGGDMGGEIVIMAADSDVCDEPIIIDENNFHEYKDSIPSFGGGGTDLCLSVHSGLRWCEENGMRVQAVVYLTDLGDIPPKRAEMPDNLPKMLYVTTQETYSEKFRHAVSDYADVVVIEDGAEIDFDCEPAMR